MTNTITCDNCQQTFTRSPLDYDYADRIPGNCCPNCGYDWDFNGDEYRAFVQDWHSEFWKIYTRRVGILEDHQATSPNEIAIYIARGYTPNQAVSNQIEKYGLRDFDQAPPPITP
jgi:hypothetical protein